MNRQFGFYKPDYTPRKAALYLHNLTSILADRGTLKKTGSLKYSIANQPATVQEMLLQKSNGSFELVFWSELVKGSQEVTIDFGSTQPLTSVYDPTRVRRRLRR